MWQGTPDEPRCKFSRELLSILPEIGVTAFAHFDVLSEPSARSSSDYMEKTQYESCFFWQVRAGLKRFAKWDRFPQLYANGAFLGGLDVVREMVALKQTVD